MGYLDKPKVGDTRGWVKARKHKSGAVQGASGYRWEIRNGKGMWIKYHDGKPAGPFKGKGTPGSGNIDVVGGIAKWSGPGMVYRAHKGALKIVKGINKRGKQDEAKRKELGIGEFKEHPNKRKKRLAKKNQEVTSTKTATTKTPTQSKSQPKVSTQEQTERAAWLKKTRNSPAAEAGVFSDDERWALQKKHRAWKAARRKPKKKR